MSKIGVTAKFTKPGGNTYTLNLSLLSYKDEELHVIYSPALDLFGYGNTEQEAKDSFQVTLGEFVRYTVNKKTFEKELQRLGWKFENNKKRRNLTAPELDVLLRDNEMLHDIVTNKEFHKYNQQVEVPAYA